MNLEREKIIKERIKEVGKLNLTLSSFFEFRSINNNVTPEELIKIIYNDLFINPIGSISRFGRHINIPISIFSFPVKKIKYRDPVTNTTKVFEMKPNQVHRGYLGIIPNTIKDNIYIIIDDYPPYDTGMQESSFLSYENCIKVYERCNLITITLELET